MTQLKSPPSAAMDSGVQRRLPSSRRGVGVLFLAPGDVAKGRVEPILWMQTCSAYAELGLDVTLVALGVRRPDAVPSADVWRHYGLKPTFRIAVVPTPLNRDAPTWWFRLWAGAAALAFALRTTLRQVVRPRPLIIHTRLPVLAAPFVLSRLLLARSRRPRLILETHALPRSSHGWVLRRVDVVVTNSEKLAEDIAVRFGIPAGQALHAPLPPHNHVRPRDKAQARARLGLPAEAPIACYTGKLTEQHSEFLLGAACALASRAPAVRWLLVGGNPEILEWTRRKASALGVAESVVLSGFVDPARVQYYHAAADVLVHHMPESDRIYPYCTPAKAYEYQAAERPIVATDLPLFEEVFGPDGERAIRVRERTPEALADGVIKAFALENGGRVMTERAGAWVRERTWERRAEVILGALAL